MNAHQIVEAVLFACDAPLTADEIARADESLNEDIVQEAIDFLQAEYGDADRSFQIVEVAEGYQILTRAEFAPYLERFDNVPRPSRLSGPALETLAIIAYRQPLGRVEIEYIRGVGSSGVIHTLQDRALIEVVGRAEGLGRPLLYGTTRHFLEHFGFKSLEDLPRPEELPVILRDRVPLGPPEDEEEEDDGQEELSLDGEDAHAAEVQEDESASETDTEDPADADAGEPVDADEDDLEADIDDAVDADEDDLDSGDEDEPDDAEDDLDLNPRADDEPDDAEDDGDAGDDGEESPLRNF